MNKKYKPFVSIIIPLYVDVPRFYLDLSKFSLLTYKNYEILVVTDRKDLRINQKNVRVIKTKSGRTGPAEKRDIAIKACTGEICAFIDDDAYPNKDWITTAIKYFENPLVAAVGGPGITPNEDTYWEQLTGLVYSSFFCSGNAQYRFVHGRKQFVDDYPAYNLLVRKSVLLEVDGYGSHFYGGEDTLLCMKIVNAGHKILYSPKVIVFHHRRALFIPYLLQIANVGKHRGYFARVYPGTSRRLGYFLPSLLSIGLAFLLIVSVFNYMFAIFTLLSFLFFWVIASLSVASKTNILNAIVVGLGIILTHISYGLSFIQGFFTKSLLR